MAESESLKRGPGEGSASVVFQLKYQPRYLRWQYYGRTVAVRKWNLTEPIRQASCAADGGARVE